MCIATVTNLSLNNYTKNLMDVHSKSKSLRKLSTLTKWLSIVIVADKLLKTIQRYVGDCCHYVLFVNVDYCARKSSLFVVVVGQGIAVVLW